MLRVFLAQRLPLVLFKYQLLSTWLLHLREREPFLLRLSYASSEKNRSGDLVYMTNNGLPRYLPGEKFTQATKLLKPKCKSQVGCKTQSASA